ncbi:hypothetical protein SAMN05421503_0513 [Terribacillus aidingensis]|uniref:Uncharacterized protein n=1 Tax=Terribacillus aidingensis TaxID=586416 RepID=A0A285N3G6_9BACI|nr:hypothetical protein [Terribacillus aidingensis]SNZ04024.1 hypothetical protein SAMN05421503_0513 [Terribacillus aidingensis]
MITKESLPQPVTEASERNRQQQDERMDLCPAVYKENKIPVHYYFIYMPSNDRLLVAEDGRVPAEHEVEEMAGRYYRYMTSVQTIQRLTSDNGVRLTDKRYHTFQDLLENVEKNVMHLATEMIQQSFSRFSDLLNTIRDQQLIILKHTDEAEKLMNDTLEKGTFTTEELELMEKHVNQIIQAQYTIAQKKQETMDSQAEVFEFFKEEMWLDLKLMTYYVRLRHLRKELWREDEAVMKNPDRPALLPSSQDDQFVAFIKHKLRNERKI